MSDAPRGGLPQELLQSLVDFPNWSSLRNSVSRGVCGFGELESQKGFMSPSPSSFVGLVHADHVVEKPGIPFKGGVRATRSP